MYRQIPAGLKQRAETELNEVTTRILDDMKHIQQWLEKEPHLNFKMDNQLLLAFLRSSKFSLERTKKKIDIYFTLRTFLPEIFSTRDPLLQEMQDILNSGLILPLPVPEDDHGCRIILLNLSTNLNPDSMSFVNINKLVYMIVDILLMEDDYTVISGLKTVHNQKNCSSKYVLQITPPLLKKYLRILESYPIRVRGMYSVFCPQVFEYVFNIMKVFLPKKLGERIFLYSENNSNELFTKVPQRLLPEEFGGRNGSVKQLTVEWKKKVESYREWFLKTEKFKSNESLRRGAPKTTSDIFGIEGSFRKLDID